MSLKGMHSARAVGCLKERLLNPQMRPAIYLLKGMYSGKTMRQQWVVRRCRCRRLFIGFARRRMLSDICTEAISQDCTEAIVIGR